LARFEKDSPIREVLDKCPRAVDIFTRHGLNCYECMGADIETIGEGALMHDVELAPLLKELNDCCPKE
jgi:hybrid cluster-associated redox disulfide protein